MNRICAPRATTRRPVFRARCSSASWTRSASLRESAGMAPGTFEERILTEEGGLGRETLRHAWFRGLVAAIRSRSPAERDILLDRLRELLSRRVRVRFDGTPAPFEVGFPERVSDPAAVADAPGATVFGLTAE